MNNNNKTGKTGHVFALLSLILPQMDGLVLRGRLGNLIMQKQICLSQSL